MQPFGYTGYQRDKVAGTYYAQAREYVPGNGRFHGTDVMSGVAASPFTQNRYSYCFNSPVVLVDWNGAWTSLSDIGNGIKNGWESVKKIGSAVVGAIGGILGAPAAIGKIGTILGLSKTALNILAKPFMIGGISSGISTLVGEGLEFLTGTQRRSGREIIIDILENSILGGGLSFLGSKIKIPGLNSGRNSYQSIFLSGIRKLVNGTGEMHLKTLVKGYVIQFIESLRDGFGTELYDWGKGEFLKCEKD